MNPWERSAEYDAHVVRNRLEIQKSVVDDFLRSSWEYAAITYDAVKGSADEGEIKRWKGEVFDKYKSDLNRITVYFGDHMILATSRALEINRELYNHYKSRKSNNWESIKDEFKSKREDFKKQNNEIARLALQELGLLPDKSE